MDIAEIISAAGGASKLAKALGCHHSSILEWKVVPIQRVERVAEITGIPAATLRPDLARLFASPQPEQAA